MSDSLSKAALASSSSARDSGLTSSEGVLYIIATPIGNLKDISHRAIEVLSKVSLILAEDTRHSKRLLNHYGISTKMRACHEHNEASLVDSIKAELLAGNDIALISDAGTPLISDPGFVLVRELRRHGMHICTVPGASSIIAALSIAGLPTDSFVFDGFLSAKGPARRTQLETYKTESRTIVVLESSHRIVDFLQDVVLVLGASRQVVIARELTKKFETVVAGDAQTLFELLTEDQDQTRGEFVVIIEGAPPIAKEQGEIKAMMSVLIAELPLKQASGIGAKLSGERKNDLYDLALELKAEQSQ